MQKVILSEPVLDELYDVYTSKYLNKSLRISTSLLVTATNAINVRSSSVSLIGCLTLFF